MGGPVEAFDAGEFSLWLALKFIKRGRRVGAVKRKIETRVVSPNTKAAARGGTAALPVMLGFE